MKKTIIMYEGSWCGDCKRSKAYLRAHNIPFTSINVDKVKGAVEVVKKISSGMASIPVIMFPNGEVLVEPTNEALAKAVDTNKGLLG